MICLGPYLLRTQEAPHSRAKSGSCLQILVGFATRHSGCDMQAALTTRRHGDDEPEAALFLGASDKDTRKRSAVAVPNSLRRPCLQPEPVRACQ